MNGDYDMKRNSKGKKDRLAISIVNFTIDLSRTYTVRILTVSRQASPEIYMIIQIIMFERTLPTQSKGGQLEI